MTSERHAGPALHGSTWSGTAAPTRARAARTPTPATGRHCPRSDRRLAPVPPEGRHEAATRVAAWRTAPTTSATTRATTTSWSGSTASWCRASARWSRSSTPASCSATASGRACASTSGHPAFLERHLDRLFEGARAIALDIGMTREELTRGHLRDTLRANDMRRRRARPADGHPRRQAHALPGPARDDRSGDRGDRRRAQGAAAGHGDRGHHPVHHPRAPRGPRHARPQAQRAQQAQRHHGLHPGLHRRRRRGADARPARLRRDLQLDPLLHRRARRRGAGPPTGATASAGSPAPTCSRSAAPTASLPARRRSA